MGQILAKILSEKYGVIIFFALVIYVLNNWSSSSSNTPPSGPCAAGLTLCNTDCVNLQTDENNCGSCGNDLASILPNAVCSGGVVQCANTFTDCGVGAWPDCVNTNTDILHCGGCYQTSANATCVSGQFVCDTDFAKCGGLECSIDLNTDPDHCGGCNNTFVTTGVEVPTCVDGLPACLTSTYCVGGQGCTDTDNDPLNCGGCGITSPNISSCVGGVINCSSWYAECTSGVPCSINLQTDVNNCGVCDRSLTVDNGAQVGGDAVLASCVDGVAVCSDPSFTYCQDIGVEVGCKDLLTDPNHCSVCNEPCPPSLPDCVGGTCIDINDRSTCGIAQTDCLEFSEFGGAAYAQCCNQQCIHTGLDFDNCGSCGNVCNEFPGGQCINGVCFYP